MRRFLASALVLATVMMLAPLASADHGQCGTGSMIRGFVLVLPGGFYLQVRDIVSDHEVVGVLLYKESNDQTGLQLGGGPALLPDNPFVSDVDPCFPEGDALMAVFVHRPG